MKKLFGNAIYNDSNRVLIYRAGKNYVGVSYNPYGMNGFAQVAVLFNKDFVGLVKSFGL